MAPLSISKSYIVCILPLSLKESALPPDADQQAMHVVSTEKSRVKQKPQCCRLTTLEIFLVFTVNSE